MKHTAESVAEGIVQLLTTHNEVNDIPLQDIVAEYISQSLANLSTLEDTFEGQLSLEELLGHILGDVLSRRNPCNVTITKRLLLTSLFFTKEQGLTNPEILIGLFIDQMTQVYDIPVTPKRIKAVKKVIEAFSQ